MLMQLDPPMHEHDQLAVTTAPTMQMQMRQLCLMQTPAAMRFPCTVQNCHASRERRCGCCSMCAYCHLGEIRAPCYLDSWSKLLVAAKLWPAEQGLRDVACRLHELQLATVRSCPRRYQPSRSPWCRLARLQAESVLHRKDRFSFLLETGDVAFDSSR